MIVDRGFQSSHGGLLPGINVASELLVLTFEKFCSAEGVNGAMLRRSHEPGARIIRDARLWPTFESGDKGVLCEVFRQTDVTNHARESGDEAGELDSPDGVDGAMDVGGHDPPPMKTSLIRPRNQPHHLCRQIAPKCCRIFMRGAEILPVRTSDELRSRLPSRASVADEDP